jgi:hypothetical protein
LLLLRLLIITAAARCCSAAAVVTMMMPMVVEWNREEGGPSVLLACPHHHQPSPPPFFKVFTVFAISTDSAAFSEPIDGSIMLFCALLARLVCAFSTESFTFQVLPHHTPKREANSCYECIFTPPVVLLWTLASSSSAAPGCGTSFPLHCTTRCLQ